MTPGGAKQGSAGHNRTDAGGDSNTGWDSETFGGGREEEVKGWG